MTARLPRTAGARVGDASERAATRELALIAAAQVLALGTWFAASAVAPALEDAWHLDGAQVPLLTSAVQVGFVVGAVVSATVNLADRFHPPHVMAAGALGAAACTAVFAASADGLATALPLRFLTGACLAAVYPVGLKLASSWFSRRRGLALGVLVGALTLGSTLPQLIGGTLGDAWRPALAVSAGLAVLAALVALRTQVGPFVAPATRIDPGFALRMVRHRGARLASLGYFGHMWELYAVWTWVPAYLTASAAAAGTPVGAATRGAVCFVTFGLGGALGCLVGGRVGDRWGRPRTAAAAMLASGSCCVLAAVLYGRSLWLLAPVLAVWGITVIADSALFSACTTVVVDPRHVGTALTAQTAVGFLVTVVTIQGFPLVVDAVSWPVAVLLLAPGPLLGSLAMLRLAPQLPQSVARSGSAA